MMDWVKGKKNRKRRGIALEEGGGNFEQIKFEENEKLASET